MVKQIHLKDSYYALVDDEDYDDLIQFKWHMNISKNKQVIYARRSWWLDSKCHSEYMHKRITGFAQTDHINGNGLDNRRSNLRKASNFENQMNKSKQIGIYTSRYKGVYWHKNKNIWCARITFNGVRHHLGYFDDELEAAKAYDIAAYDYHGVFAKTNGAWNANH